MSGFKYDVVAILRQTGILQTDAVGWVDTKYSNPDTMELFSTLQKEKFPVTSKAEKMVILFDYIILDTNHATLEWFLRAMANLGAGGVIVMDVSDHPADFLTSYKIRLGNFSITKVSFPPSNYLVLHPGIDYAD